MDAHVDEIIKNFSAHSGSGVSGIQYSKMFGVKQKFSILPQKIGEFLDDICDLCNEDEHTENTYYDDIANQAQQLDYNLIGHPIAEVISKRTIPIMITMKFSFNLSPTHRDDPSLYDESFILHLVYMLQSCIKNKINVSPGLSELITVVEESQVWTVNNTSYVMVRFTFPYCQVDVGYQRGKFREHIIDELHRGRLIDEMDIKPTNEWASIIQEIKDTVLMYRGKEDQAACPMTLTHMYHAIQKSDYDNGSVQSLALHLNTFNPEHYQYIYQNVTPKEFLSKDVELKYWLPMFLSIYFWSGEATVKDVEIPPDMDIKADIEYDESVLSKDPKIMVQHLLPLLSVDRFNIEPFWKEIVQILHNIYEGGEQGLTLAIQFSQKATEEGRDKDACSLLYRTMTENHLTIKTIGWYARKDSPQGYEQWHGHWSKYYLLEALDPVNDNVAEAFYRVFWLDHIWVGGKRWFTFSKHRLIEQDDATDLKRDIREIMIPIYYNLRQDVATKAAAKMTGANKQGDRERKEAETLIKLITEFVRKIGGQAFKNQCIKAAQVQFEVKNFDLIKDRDPNKMGWSNCVSVCSGDYLYTIDGKLEDYITKNTHCPYRSDLTWQHPLVLRLMTWLGQVFPDKELLHYFLKDLSSMLYGRNAEKLLRAWCGDGNNSKSMLAKAIQYWLGLYCIDFPATFLTGKAIGQSGPSPELAQAEGAHLGIVPETENDEKIREGTVKRATGGDRQFARKCNVNGGSFEMGAKIIILCNSVPEFTSISKALRARFIYIPFLSNWVINAPDSIEEQYRTRTFKLDPFFDSQIPELAQALGWVAVQYYHYYKLEGLVQPPIVDEYTKRHWEENDPILGFIQECLTYVYANAEHTELDMTRGLTSTEVYPLFKKWYSGNYPGEIPPINTHFKASMQQHLGPQRNKRWYGVQLAQHGNQTGISQPMVSTNMPQVARI